MFTFDSQRTDVWNRKIRVSKSCLCRIFKQASVISSRFDVIDNFYRGIQHILQRSNNHISIATLQNQKRFLHLSNICTCCSLQFLTKQELLF